MTARGPALLWLIASGLWLLLMIGLVAYGVATKTTESTNATPPPSNMVVVPTDVREFCSASNGSALCFGRDDDGKLLLKCAVDEIHAAMFRVPLCSEVSNAK